MAYPDAGIQENPNVENPVQPGNEPSTCVSGGDITVSNPPIHLGTGEGISGTFHAGTEHAIDVSALQEDKAPVSIRAEETLDDLLSQSNPVNTSEPTRDSARGGHTISAVTIAENQHAGSANALQEFHLESFRENQADPFPNAEMVTSLDGIDLNTIFKDDMEEGDRNTKQTYPNPNDSDGTTHSLPKKRGSDANFKMMNTSGNNYSKVTAKSDEDILDANAMKAMDEAVRSLAASPNVAVSDSNSQVSPESQSVRLKGRVGTKKSHKTATPSSPIGRRRSKRPRNKDPNYALYTKADVRTRWIELKSLIDDQQDGFDAFKTRTQSEFERLHNHILTFRAETKKELEGYQSRRKERQENIREFGEFLDMMVF